MAHYKIGEVAQQAGVTVEAIRFYEAQALLPEPPRAPSGYRLYGSETVRRVRFILRAKELGFSLKDIGALLALRGDPAASCGEVKARALQKLDMVARKIDDLRRIRRALADLTVQCDANAELSECPILDALDRMK